MVFSLNVAGAWRGMTDAAAAETRQARERSFMMEDRLWKSVCINSWVCRGCLLWYWELRWVCGRGTDECERGMKEPLYSFLKTHHPCLPHTSQHHITPVYFNLTVDCAYCEGETKQRYGTFFEPVAFWIGNNARAMSTLFWTSQDSCLFIQSHQSFPNGFEDHGIFLLCCPRTE